LELLPDLTGKAAEAVRQQFALLFRRTESQVDGILVNSRPLAAARALDAFSNSAHLLLVLEAGPDSLTAAYQEIKALRLAHRIEALDVILADGKSPAALAAFWRLKVTSKEFLGVTLHLQTSQGQSSTAVTRVPDALLAQPISRPMERSRGITC
jgi:MinD-like ATPase involved in chromosome partitioning or flagellar assembly